SGKPARVIGASKCALGRARESGSIRRCDARRGSREIAEVRSVRLQGRRVDANRCGLDSHRRRWRSGRMRGRRASLCTLAVIARFVAAGTTRHECEQDRTERFDNKHGRFQRRHLLPEGLLERRTYVSRFGVTTSFYLVLRKVTSSFAV